MARLRSYLLEAAYDWLIDHGLTPYVMINAMHEDSDVPEDYIEDGHIVLNVAPEAVHNLNIDPEGISFEASFSGQTLEIFAPIDAVIALYSKESGQGLYAREDNFGMWVNEGETEEDLDPQFDESLNAEAAKVDTLKAAKKRGLRVIK